MAHAGSPIHLDDVVSSEVIKTDKTSKENSKHINTFNRTGYKETEVKETVFPDTVNRNNSEPCKSESFNSKVKTEDSQDVSLNEKEVKVVPNTNDTNNKPATNLYSDLNEASQYHNIKSHSSVDTIVLKALVNGDICDNDLYDNDEDQVIHAKKTEKLKSSELTDSRNEGTNGIDDSSREPEHTANIIETQSNGQEQRVLESKLVQQNSCNRSDAVVTEFGIEDDSGQSVQKKEWDNYHKREYYSSAAKKAETHLLNINQEGMMPREVNSYNESYQEQAKVLKGEYKAGLHSVKPPPVDLMSLFKQTVSHKPLKNPHTYETAKAELHSFDQTDNSESLNDMVPSSQYQSNRSPDHEVLLSAVHELQIIFDRAATAGPYSMSKQNVSLSNVKEKQNQDSILNSECNLSQKKDKTQSPGNLSESQADIINANGTVKREKLNVEFANSDAEIAVGAQELDYQLVVKQKSKPKKLRNRSGYTGKFAIAHMLHQTDLSHADDEVKVNDKSGMDIDTEVATVSGATEMVNKDSKNTRVCGEVEITLKKLNQYEMTPGNQEIDQRYVADSHTFVLESVPEKEQIQSNSETRAREQERAERRVSFSSDELVTEDSESDSSSADSMLNETQIIDGNKRIRKGSYAKKPVWGKQFSHSKSSGRAENKSSKGRNRSSYVEEPEFSDNQSEVLEETSYANFYQPQYSSCDIRLDEIHPHNYPDWSGYPYYPLPHSWQHYYPTNLNSQWYPPYHSHYQQYPKYSFQPPYWPYSVPHLDSEKQADPFLGYYKMDCNSEERVAQSMKHAFEIQNDYIKEMCQKPDIKYKRKTKRY